MACLALSALRCQLLVLFLTRLTGGGWGGAEAWAPVLALCMGPQKLGDP